uniref:Uncharacterized protein n=1 Tax=Rhizophora mucronata TaxID=61149 RepID=A0A2P2N8W2_RHIMU
MELICQEAAAEAKLKN